MENQRDKQFTLPKNIRQMGSFGDTYKIYVEDFVYTYVHQFLHRKKEENEVIAAVLLGEVIKRDEQEYVFVSGAQKVDFRISEEGEPRKMQRPGSRNSGETYIRESKSIFLTGRFLAGTSIWTEAVWN